MHLKLLQKVIQKTSETACDLIGNKIAKRATKVSKNSQQINSESLTNKHYKEIPKERYKPLEERQNIVNEMRLI